ncbi:hypothetical protein BC828DRAFT_391210, partial [Blastocladiella britannica]
MENISLILDRILLFASHKAYSLAVGLELLRVVPRIDAHDTHRHIIRRLVDVHDLGSGGHLDLLRLLDRPLSDNEIYPIASGAATAGHAHILDWILDEKGGRLSAQGLQNLEHLAVTHGRVNVLDQRTAHGVDLCSDLNRLFSAATRYCKLLSLDWLRAYAAKRALNYTFNPAGLGLVIIGPHTNADQHVSTLDWWKADYAARSEPLYPANVSFSDEPAWRVKNGLLLVDWWRNYCAEAGRDFKWPALDARKLNCLVRIDSLSLCQWWWSDTVHKLGTQEAKQLLRGILDPICTGGRTEYLAWFWELCANSGGEIEFPRNWRPHLPFKRLNVIQWWEAKVASGHVDPSVFDIAASSSLTKLDLILNISDGSELETAALDWWWARRDRVGLEPRLSAKVLLVMVQRHDPAPLTWYFDHCTSASPLPRLSLNVLISMASRGRADVVEQLLQLLVTYKKPLTFNVLADEVDRRQFHNRIAASTVLDYLWEIFARIGMRFEPCYNSKSAIAAMEAGNIDATHWWYAMHRVHGTVFPSAAELSSVKCAPDSAMARWIRSIQAQ